MIEEAQTFIDRKLKYWKKVGYTIDYLRLDDGRLKVKFINNSEKIPCYIEYLKDRIICYGDYGSFVFENYLVNYDPTGINYTSIRYFLGKVDRTCNTEEFSYDKAIADLKKWKDGYLENENMNRYEFEEFTEGFYLLLSSIEDYNIWSKLEKFFKSIDYSDWEEEFSNIGLVYTSHALAQLVMLQLIDEDYRKKEKI